jgi:hypothetical protein
MMDKPKAKRQKRGSYQAQARKLALFAMGMASMQAFFNALAVVGVLRVPLLLGAFGVYPLLGLVLSLIVLYGSWQGMRRPQVGAYASLLGGLGTAALVMTSVSPRGFDSLLVALAVFDAYVLLYFMVAALQWRTARAARREAQAEAEAARWYTNQLELDEGDATGSGALHDETLDPRRAALKKR